jgi:hypothetical protein
MKTSGKLAFGAVGAVILGLLLGGWEAVESEGRSREVAGSEQREVRPTIDRAAPARTERAVFALG